MCVLAAYLGTKPAAPILLEMLEKEEGLAGGYYTGLATLADGRLHYEKVVGDVAALRRETKAAELPGTIGIAHSRTPSGGDREWSHPFIDCTGRLAYVAQGAMGFFRGKTDLDAAAGALAARGHVFRSAVREKIGSYPVMPDGRCVHVSEVMCHAVEQEFAERGDLLEAMRAAYCRWPAEIVGMTIHQDCPDRIVAACINQPLVIGRDESASYAASTRLALPGSVNWVFALPPNAAAAIYAQDIVVRPFGGDAEPVVCDWSSFDAESTVLRALKEEPGMPWGKALEAIRPLWPAGRLTRRGLAGYEVLAALLRAGKIRTENVRVPGMFNLGTVPQTRVFPA